MSFHDVRSSGNGRLDYRLEILGLPYQFVSNARLAGVATLFTEETVSRLNGLRMKGKSFGYSIDALAGELTGDAMTFDIVDLDEQVTALLASNPTKAVRLVQNLSDSDTNVYCTNIDGWAVDDYAYIGQETLRVVGLVPADNRLDCSRNALYSEPFAYYVEGEFKERSAITVSDIPITLQGRKVKLYAYGESDNPTGEGTIIWRGVLNSDLQLTNAGVWSLQANSIVSKLDQEIGGGGLGKEFQIRGVYHPDDQAFTLEIGYGTLFMGTAATPRMSVKHYGFNETPRDFVDKFNVQLQHSASVAGFANQMWLDIVPDGKLGLFFRTKTSFVTPSNPEIVYVRSDNGLKENDADGVYGIVPEETFDPILYHVELPEMGGTYGTFTRMSHDIHTDTVYAWLTKVPYPEAIAGYHYTTAGIDEVYPGGRIYFNAPFVPTTVTELRGTQEGSEDNLVRSLSGTSPINASRRSIDTHATNYYVLRNEDTTFTFAGSLVTSGSVVDFFTKLTEFAPLYGSQGLYPVITSDDIDLLDMGKTMSSTLQTPFVAQRNFTFWGEGKKLSEIFAEECKILGCFPSVTAEGKITMKRLRDFGKNEVGTFQVTGSNFLNKNGFPTWTRSSDSIVNEAQLLTGYNPDEDKHMGDTYNALYTDSLAIFQKKKKYKLTPFSQETVLPDLNEIDVILWRVLGKWGVPRPEVSNVEVPFTAMSATVGDGAYLRIAQLPNSSNGTRGLEQVGLIRSISYDLDQGKASMNIVLTDPGLTGYAPSLQVVSGGVSTGTTYTLRVSSSAFAPYGARDIDFFRTGDKVQIQDYKSWTPTIRTTGTLSNPVEVGGVCYVDLTLSATFAGKDVGLLSSSFIHLPAFSSSNLTIYQQQFCFISSGSVNSFFGA